MVEENDKQRKKTKRRYVPPPPLFMNKDKPPAVPLRPNRDSLDEILSINNDDNSN